jgi:hypothetical protein
VPTGESVAGAGEAVATADLAVTPVDEVHRNEYEQQLHQEGQQEAYSADSSSFHPVTGASVGPTPQWVAPLDPSLGISSPPLSPPPAPSVASSSSSSSQSSSCPTDERGRPLCRRSRKSLKRRLEEVERDLHENLSLPKWFKWSSWSFEPVWLSMVCLHVLFAMEGMFLALEDSVVKRNWATGEEEGKGTSKMRPSTWPKKWRMFVFRLKGFLRRVGMPVGVLLMCVLVVGGLALETATRGGQGGWRDVPFGWAFGQEEGEARLGLASPARLLVGIEVGLIFVFEMSFFFLLLTVKALAVSCCFGHCRTAFQAAASLEHPAAIVCRLHHGRVSAASRRLAAVADEAVGQKDRGRQQVVYRAGCRNGGVDRWCCPVLRCICEISLQNVLRLGRVGWLTSLGFFSSRCLRHFCRCIHS